MSLETEFRYDRLTWPEMNDAIGRQKVVILPVGSTEQHGPHLPLDTDAFLVEAVCHEAGRRAADRVLVLPTVAYGLNRHHIDFPGTIHIEPETFIAFCEQILKSVAYHGFQKFLIVNGHGSNMPLCDIVARKIVLGTASICAAVTYITLGMDAFEGVRESQVLAHADEFETSLYLYLAAGRVRRDQMVADNDVRGQFLSSDSTANYPARFNDYWSRWTDQGVHGDPRSASASKGEVLWEAIVSALVQFVDEWRAWPLEPRRDTHDHPVQSDIEW